MMDIRTEAVGFESCIKQVLLYTRLKDEAKEQAFASAAKGESRSRNVGMSQQCAVGFVVVWLMGWGVAGG